MKFNTYGPAPWFLTFEPSFWSFSHLMREFFYKILKGWLRIRIRIWIRIRIKKEKLDPDLQKNECGSTALLPSLSSREKKILSGASGPKRQFESRLGFPNCCFIIFLELTRQLSIGNRPASAMTTPWRWSWTRLHC